MLQKTMFVLLTVAALATAVPAAVEARPGDRGPAWNGRAYYHPPGVAYRRWAVGQVLARPYWTGNYWRVADRRAWGLAAPGRNLRWVRVGRDAILVNIRTGNIRSVRYNAFPRFR